MLYNYVWILSMLKHWYIDIIDAKTSIYRYYRSQDIDIIEVKTSIYPYYRSQNIVISILPKPQHRDIHIIEAKISIYRCNRCLAEKHRLYRLSLVCYYFKIVYFLTASNITGLIILVWVVSEIVSTLQTG